MEKHPSSTEAMVDKLKLIIYNIIKYLLVFDIFEIIIQEGKGCR